MEPPALIELEHAGRCNLHSAEDQSFACVHQQGDDAIESRNAEAPMWTNQRQV
jgi:hypothetical protein